MMNKEKFMILLKYLSKYNNRSKDLKSCFYFVLEKYNLEKFFNYDFSKI